MNVTDRSSAYKTIRGTEPARRKRLPAYAEIFYAIRGSILCGNMSIGQQIPTEQELAQQYNVSVGTIRKTQQMLVDDGLLIKMQGSGTFVSPNVMQHRRILWVCGVDVVGGDISPYFTGFLDACHRIGSQQGLAVEPAWVSHHRDADTRQYIGPDAQSRYAGYVFVGCVWEEHPLLQHIVNQGLPYVHVGHWDRHPCGVRIDIRQGISLACETLRDDGCEKISLVGFEQHRAQLKPFLKKLDLDLLLTPDGARMSHVECNGQAVMESFKPQARREGVLFVDDILARGGTRALLCRSRSVLRSLRIAVLGSRHSVIPLGLPVQHVVHDSEESAHAVFDLLGQQIASRSEPDGVDLSYALLEDADAASSLLSTAAVMS